MGLNVSNDSKRYEKLRVIVEQSATDRTFLIYSQIVKLISRR